jgi:putative addiction module CopG family antidote
MHKKTTTFSISLPETLKEKLDARLSESDFGNASEYVRTLIRSDLERAHKLANLRRMVKEGSEALERGEFAEFNQESGTCRQSEGRGPRQLVRLRPWKLGS